MPLLTDNFTLDSLPLLEQSALTSIRFGNLLFPRNSLSHTVAKSAEKLAVMNPGERHDVYFPGSATLLRFGDRFWVVCTKHQVEDANLENVSLLSNAPNLLTSSERYVFLGDHEDARESDEYDLIAFEFTSPVNDGALQSDAFLPILDSGFLQDGDRVVWAMTYGFRTVDQNDTWEDDDELGPRMSRYDFVKREILCDFQGDASDPSTCLITPKSTEISDMDGMSGGPVFLVTFDGTSYICKFAGINVRGGNGQLRFVKHTVVRRLIDRADSTGS